MNSCCGGAARCASSVLLKEALSTGALPSATELECFGGVAARCCEVAPVDARDLWALGHSRELLAGSVAILVL
eukprot:CAMPEP_0202072808 /NCGR_PEP_ID=MMETSP0964-20121228/2662_1 /ASSEMBLY_ACC=CAM_ASM_000500 /TAXON_ID=4773 /ORGANISM="Schizochytrium aggregatum, Strain ATCC28209" /LENGTH=72 /DNA_ID=CAMNT_0048639869 /DNA_START=63 /DNA_END=281 /DNA_ORIENTATION=-